jgi:hypothetical protein
LKENKYDFFDSEKKNKETTNKHVTSLFHSFGPSLTKERGCPQSIEAEKGALSV